MIPTEITSNHWTREMQHRKPLAVRSLRTIEDPGSVIGIFIECRLHFPRRNMSKEAWNGPLVK